MSRERSFAWSDPELNADAARGMEGPDMMRGLREGMPPSAPVAALIGMSIRFDLPSG